MKPYWLLSFIFGLACVIAAPQVRADASSPSKTPTALEQSAIAAEKNLIDAKKKDDPAFFKKTLAENFSLVGVDGRLLEGQEAADNLGDSGLIEIMPYDIKVFSLGDDSVIVTYDAVVRESPQEDQGPPPRYQHFSSVWQKHGDQWKLKFHQSTAAHWGDW